MNSGRKMTENCEFSVISQRENLVETVNGSSELSSCFIGAVLDKTDKLIVNGGVGGGPGLIA